MKKFLLYLVSVVILCGCHKKTTKESNAPMSVDVEEVIEDSITLTRSYSGMLEAVKSVEVVGRVNGTLTGKLYKPGDLVRQGQPLFTIESSTYANAATSAKAALEQARSEYNYAKHQYDAMQKALKEDAVAEMEVLKAKSAVDQAAASIRQATAQLNDARINIGYCTVRAPFTGYISDATLHVGAYVGGASQPVTLATLYDNSTLNVNFNIGDATFIEIFSSPEKRHENLDMQALPITFSDEVAHNYTASLVYVAPSIDASTGTLLLKANVKNPYNELRDGMYTTLNLPYRNEKHAMLVRDASIGSDQRGKYLYVINDSNKVVYTPVTVGELYNDTLRVIEKGLKPGDRYVTSALLKVRPGMKIKPIMKSSTKK